MRDSLLTGWVCPGCGDRADAGADVRACGCGALPEARYDEERAAALWPGLLESASSAASLWHYAPLLPNGTLPAGSLGAGQTPLQVLPRLGRAIGIPRLRFKDEGRNPTASFKARGLAGAMSAAHRAGATDVAVATAGNAGGACAAYAAAAGIRAHVFAPRETSPVTLAEIRACGASLVLVEGDITAAYAALHAALEDHPQWRDVSVSCEPHRIETKRTMAFELVQQYGESRPDWIILPTGGGVAVVAHDKAFRELAQFGAWEGASPRLVAAQVDGCAPVGRAYADGAAKAETWIDPEATLAEGVRVPKSGLHGRVLEAIRRTEGAAAIATESTLTTWIARCAGTEGVLLCPEGAVALAAAAGLREAGRIGEADEVVFYNTAAAYKYPAALEAAGAAH